jgi:hypothetical protein
VDPVPDALFLRISGSAENRTRTSGSVAGNCDHWATEAVNQGMFKISNRRPGHKDIRAGGHDKKKKRKN